MPSWWPRNLLGEGRFPKGCGGQGPHRPLEDLGPWQEVMGHGDSCRHPAGDSGDTGTAATTDGAPVSSPAAETAPVLGTGGTQEVPALALSPPLPSQTNGQSSHSWILVVGLVFFFQIFFYSKNPPPRNNSFPWEAGIFPSPHNSLPSLVGIWYEQRASLKIQDRRRLRKKKNKTKTKQKPKIPKKKKRKN